MKIILSKRLLIAIAAALAISAAAELLLVPERHRYFPGSDLTLFWAAFGFLGTVVMGLVVKWIGHTFLMRHEDPYTGEHIGADPGEHPDPVGADGSPPPRPARPSSGDHRGTHG